MSPANWICGICTLENAARRRRCQACQTRRPVNDDGKVITSRASSHTVSAVASPTSNRAILQERQQPQQQHDHRKEKGKSKVSVVSGPSEAVKRKRKKCQIVTVRIHLGESLIDDDDDNDDEILQGSLHAILPVDGVITDTKLHTVKVRIHLGQSVKEGKEDDFLRQPLLAVHPGGGEWQLVTTTRTQKNADAGTSSATIPSVSVFGCCSNSTLQNATYEPPFQNKEALNQHDENNTNGMTMGTVETITDASTDQIDISDAKAPGDLKNISMDRPKTEGKPTRGLATNVATTSTSRVSESNKNIDKTTVDFCVVEGSLVKQFCSSIKTNSDENKFCDIEPNTATITPGDSKSLLSVPDLLNIDNAIFEASNKMKISQVTELSPQKQAIDDDNSQTKHLLNPDSKKGNPHNIISIQPDPKQHMEEATDQIYEPTQEQSTEHSPSTSSYDSSTLDRRIRVTCANITTTNANESSSPPESFEFSHTLQRQQKLAPTNTYKNAHSLQVTAPTNTTSESRHNDVVETNPKHIEIQSNQAQSGTELSQQHNSCNNEKLHFSLSQEDDESQQENAFMYTPPATQLSQDSGVAQLEQETRCVGSQHDEPSFSMPLVSNTTFHRSPLIACEPQRQNANENRGYDGVLSSLAKESSSVRHRRDAIATTVLFHKKCGERTDLPTISDGTKGSNVRKQQSTLGFHTAGKSKPIYISEVALQKATSVLSKENPVGASGVVQQESGIVVPGSPAKTRTGSIIQTSDSQIDDSEVSAAALRRDQVSLSVSSSAELASTTLKANKSILESSVSNMVSSKPVGFCTAGSSKPIEVSEFALQHANSILFKPARTKPIGVPTPAMNEPIEVSESVQQQANNLLSEFASKELSGFQTSVTINPIEYSESARQQTNSVLFKQTRKNPAGFQTAGTNKPIEISVSALYQASNFLSKPASDMIQDFHAVNSKSAETSEFSLHQANSALSKPASKKTQGFQTAGASNPIEISASALHQANNILATPTNKQFQEFHAARTSKTTKVSESALHQTSSLFSKTKSNISVAKSVGFQTAGCSKPIKVSDSALQQASSLFSRPTSNTTVAKVVGFQTAGCSKPTGISGSALSQGNSILLRPNNNNLATQPEGALAADLGMDIAVSEPTVPRGKNSLLKAVQVVPPPLLTKVARKFTITDEIDASQPNKHQQTKDYQHGCITALSATPFNVKSTVSNVQLGLLSGGVETPDFSRPGMMANGSALLEKTNEHLPPQDAAAFDDSNAALTSASFSGGFQTAGTSKEIAVSEETLQKAGELLCDVKWQSSNDGNSDEQGIGLTNGSRSNLPTTTELQTAGRSKVITATAAVHNANRRFLRSSGYKSGSDQHECLYMQSDDDLVISAGPPGRSRKKARVSDIGLHSSRFLFHDLQSYPNHSEDNHDDDESSSEQRFSLDEETKRNEINTNALPAPHGGQLGVTPSRDRAQAAVVTISASFRKKHSKQADLADASLSPVPIRFENDQINFKKADERIEEQEKVEKESTEEKLRDRSLGERLVLFTNMAVDCHSWEAITCKLRSFLTSSVMTSSPSQCRLHGVRDQTLLVNSINAANLRFQPNGVPASFSDEAECEASDGLLGFTEDITDALVAQGCKKDSISLAWLLNHKRWIVWKLAALERRFSSIFGGHLLSYEVLLSQLYSRYCTECRDGKRPALRRVLNKDVASSTMMILCVCQIFEQIEEKQKSGGEDKPVTPSPIRYTMELTDGWYSVHGVPDLHMCERIQNGRISIGSKLMISGARLVGPDDGVDPLDDGYTPDQKHCRVFLQFSSNATRLAKWNAKLGFVQPSAQRRGDNGLLRVKRICDIVPGGGHIPLIQFIISRRFPLMFLRRYGTEKDAETISEAEEYRERAQYDRRRLNLVERFMEEVEAECTQDVDEMAPPVWIRLVQSSSPEELYHELNREDRATIDRWKSKRGSLLQSRIQQEVQAKLEDEPVLQRESKPFIRLSVRSFDRSLLTEGKPTSSDEAVLTVWQPTEEQLSLLREGIIVRAENLSTGKRTYEGRIQLSANSRTAMGAVPSTPLSRRIFRKSGFTERTYASIFQLHVCSRQLSQASASTYDFVGVVLKVTDEESSHRTFIYLTDKSNLVVRVQCRNIQGLGDLIGLRSPIARQSIEHPRVIAFRDVTIMPFDKAERVAVVDFRSGVSSLWSHATEPTTASLRCWVESPEGRKKLVHLATYCDANLNPMQQYVATFHSALGYIAGITVQSSNQLRILVDCATGIQEWAFPLHLVHDVNIPSSATETVCLNPADEKTCSQMCILGKIFRARGTLFHFVLRRTPQSITISRPCKFEVCQIKEADMEAVAGVYELLMKAK